MEIRRPIAINMENDLERPGNVDPMEVERFADLAKEWWNASGKFRPLHQISPIRITFIRDQICHAFGRRPLDLIPLRGLRILDIGCGGGLVAEPLTRLGANVTGIDPAGSALEAARQHARQQELEIDYRDVEAGELVAAGEQFDVVLCLEVLEHVPDISVMTRTCAALSKPNGVLVYSTINRTLKSYALAILGAEYVLGWLPKGTHRWDRFVTLDELAAYVRQVGCNVLDTSGLVYRPLYDRWALSNDTDVNYLLSAVKPSSDGDDQ